MKWRLNDTVMNNILWLCLRTNRTLSRKEPTVCSFELAFRPTNKNICQKKWTHSYFIIGLPCEHWGQITHQNLKKQIYILYAPHQISRITCGACGLRPVHKCIYDAFSCTPPAAGYAVFHDGLFAVKY